MMKQLRLLCVGGLAAVISQFASATVGPSYVTYVAITYFSTTPSGVLVQVTGAAVPANCAGGNPDGLMLVPEANKTIVAAIMLAKATNKLVDVYSAGPVNGMCTINQVRVYE